MHVELDQSTQSSTDLATNQQYGCSIDDEFFAEGAQVLIIDIRFSLFVCFLSHRPFAWLDASAFFLSLFNASLLVQVSLTTCNY